MNSQLLLQVTELPPPSKILWKDQKRILVNPQAYKIPTLNFAETEQETCIIQKIAKRTSIMNSIFLCNTTAMNACHRVFCLFMPVLIVYKDIEISSQPTVKDNSDYMFHLTREADTHTNKPLLIIEVKREATSCHISETPAFPEKCIL